MSKLIKNYKEAEHQLGLARLNLITVFKTTFEIAEELFPEVPEYKWVNIAGKWYQTVKINFHTKENGYGKTGICFEVYERGCVQMDYLMPFEWLEIYETDYKKFKEIVSEKFIKIEETKALALLDLDQKRKVKNQETVKQTIDELRKKYGTETVDNILKQETQK